MVFARDSERVDHRCNPSPVQRTRLRLATRAARIRFGPCVSARIIQPPRRSTIDRARPKQKIFRRAAVNTCR